MARPERFELEAFCRRVRRGRARACSRNPEHSEGSHSMARPERFELPTFWFVARRSIQLS
jgi:hypothetical protein